MKILEYSRSSVSEGHQPIVPGAMGFRPLVFHAWSVYCGPGTLPCPVGPSAEGRQVSGSRHWLCGWLGRSWPSRLLSWEQEKTYEEHLPAVTPNGRWTWWV